MNVRRATAVVVLLPIVLGIAALGIVMAQDSEQSSPPAPLEDEYPGITVDNSKPRFDGEMLGIRLGTTQALADAGYLDDAQPCSDTVDVVSGHASIPQAPLYLPEGAVQPELAPALVDEPNPGGSICASDGTPLRTWRYFEFPQLENGLVPSILVNRVFLDEPYRKVDAPQDRIEVRDVGGRDAVVVAPVVPEGGTVASLSQVIFPESTGYLVVQSNVLAFAEVLKVAASLEKGE